MPQDPTIPSLGLYPKKVVTRDLYKYKNVAWYIIYNVSVLLKQVSNDGNFIFVCP